MALFQRRKSQTISELEDYYSNRNNSTAKAWVMALLSLLVTVALLSILFFGGRWIYRTLTNDGVTVVTTTSTTENNPDTTIEVAPATDMNHSDGTNHDTATKTPAVEPEGVVSDRAATTTTPRTATGTNSRTTTPTTGDATLPKTGTSETVLGALMFISLTAGVYAYRKKQLRA